MTAQYGVRPESERIDFLLGRDGNAETRKWVERTATLYRAALEQPHHYAADPVYRPRFERAVREFQEWIDSCGPDDRSPVDGPSRSK